MAGITAASAAAALGASVVVLEIAPDIGGSALMSQGFLWTAPSEETFLAQDPAGNVAAFRLLLAEFAPALEWLRSHDIWVSPRMSGLLGYGEGHQVDMTGFFGSMARMIEANGGIIARKTVTDSLIVENGAVVGAQCHDRGTGEAISIFAKATILATGGFQASPDLRRQYMPTVPHVIVRSNPYSDGSGIRLGATAGCALSDDMEGFYGHLLPYPGDNFDESEFATLAFFESEYGVLLASDGTRFCDESLGDHVNVQEVAKLGHALLIVDEPARVSGLGNLLDGADGSTKWATAAMRGAHYATAFDLEQLSVEVSGWGYPKAQVLRSLQEFQEALDSHASNILPPRARNRTGPKEAPFHAIEVQAGMTFTYGGLRTDLDGRALDKDGDAIRGLFVAGADRGGFNAKGYAGGLIRGLVFGRRVAAAACGPQS
jgi:succinate dehydrogenase/fumarate reductase flavoprotein subunit